MLKFKILKTIFYRYVLITIGDRCKSRSAWTSCLNTLKELLIEVVEIQINLCESTRSTWCLKYSITSTEWPSAEQLPLLNNSIFFFPLEDLTNNLTSVEQQPLNNNTILRLPMGVALERLHCSLLSIQCNTYISTGITRSTDPD